MRLILYCSQTSDYLSDLGSRLRDRLAGHEVLLLNNLPDLHRALTHLDAGPQAACLIMADQPEMQSILDLGHLLETTRLAVVVPDERDNTLSLAHRMKPRYLTSCQETESLADVLERMAGTALLT